MTNTTEAAQRDALAPCPFCGVSLIVFSEAQGYEHPLKGDCPLSGFRMEADGYSEARWNRRAALSQPSPASSTLECGWCGLKYAEGQHFYDDTCNPCARQRGLREALEEAKKFIANIRYRLSHEGYRTENIRQCIADCERQYAALSGTQTGQGEA